MKNYKQILEAINKGILLALDDFDDEEQILHVKSKQVLNRDYTKEYLDLMEEVVDLGLPSGTLWCKYNLGVDSNLLTEPEDWYGKYYAWGEILPNKTNKKSEIYFGWDNYKYGKYDDKLTKYCNDPEYGNGFTDNLTELLPEDDAAYLNKKLYNYKFHIPTKEQCEELINCTKNYRINNYDPNKLVHNPKDDGGIQGLNGRIFEGRNGNLIFIPAAGYCHISYAHNAGSYDYLWTSRLSIDCPNRAYYMCNGLLNSASRFIGFSIRPVINL